jgi:phosphoglycolate phosphatase
VVSGDTLSVKKPDPAPVLLACERAGVDPVHCLFVGDDRRDIQAGAAAGLFTVAVSWGYLDGGDPHAWGADVVVDRPAELAALLQLEPSVA